MRASRNLLRIGTLSRGKPLDIENDPSHSFLTVYGAQWCSDCKRAKMFLGEQRVHYHWVDVENDAAGLALVERLNDGKRIIPTIGFADGRNLVESSNAELAAKLGLQAHAKLSYYDLVVVGSGPAGHTAAFYAAREGLAVLVIERCGVGGLYQEGESRYVTTADGTEYGARAVLTATGSTCRRLGVAIRDRKSGETELLEPSAIFVFIGLSPNTGWLPASIEWDSTGFIKTNRMLKTTIPGVFAAGDARLGSTKPSASAAGEGATAALMVREYLMSI